MKRLQAFILGLVLVLPVVAQLYNPVRFTVSQRQVSPSEIEVVFAGQIAHGWHVYSTDLGSEGPVSATLTTEEAEGAEASGKLKAQGHEIHQFDQVFGMNLRYFEDAVTFVQRYKLTGGKYHVKGFLEYGACNDTQCMPPTEVAFDYAGVSPQKDDKEVQTSKDTMAVADAVAPPIAADSSVVAEETASSLWHPVVEDLRTYNGENGRDRSLPYVLLMGFLGGLLALFTPCVWPIIPMTVSFFLKRAKDNRKRGVRDAVVYGVSIVVIYLVLGLAVTALFGASKLNELATNAVFNIFFFLLLVVFALSFFGWFEIRLPSRWSNAVDSKASEASGLLSIFLMAFTLTLVSFSCTGPIIGFLLVEVSTLSGILGPAVGMLGFALALALPFTLFALFPAWLKQVPKSGGWMNVIKVTLGFIELAFALKFFSVADQAYGWGLLDREVFLALWIAIFALMGAYLVGWLRFQSDEPLPAAQSETGEAVGVRARPVACILLGLLSFSFALYMVPGLWGAPCKAVSAFAPPMSTQDFNLYANKEVRARYTDFEEGMAAARAQHKPVLIDFTGFGCVNCRKMEAAVWTDARVADLLNNDYVLVSLYVDDKTPLPEKQEIQENGKRRILRTVGDRWSYLQRFKFGANAQPFYVALDADGNLLGGSYGYDEDVQKYLQFLRQGLERFRR